MVKITRFADVPQFTRYPDDHGHTPIRYIRDIVDQNIRDNNLQLCPDFQRGHVWTEAQQVSYVEYVLRGGKSGLDVYFNHPGWKTGEKGEYVCVDGLQRITALLRFVDNEIPAFGSLYSEFTDRLSISVGIVWHVNTLKTRKEVLTWYVEMNDGGTPHTDAELDRVRKMIEEA
jgi:hypothetical protein